MRLYHTTDLAAQILAEGFRDGPSSFSASFSAYEELRQGVWLADRVMTYGDFSHLGADVLVVEVPADVAAPYEQPEDALGLPPDMPYYRAFVIPAEVVNRYPVVRLG